MEYVNAFLLGGFLCAAFQLLLVVTRLDPPRLLILGFALGAALTPFGITGKLVEWGGAGIAVMVVDAGEAVFGATLQALGGNWTAVGIVLAVFAAVPLLGLAAGMLYVSRTRQPVAAAAPQEN